MPTKTKNENALCVTQLRKIWAAHSAVMVRKSTLPHIESVMVSSNGEGICLTSTDLDIFLQTTIDQPRAGTWKTLIHQSVLKEALKGKPGNATVRFEKEQVVFGNGMAYKIDKPIDIEAFPAPLIVGNKWDPLAFPLSHVIAAGRYASTDVTRFQMNGVCINPDRGEIAATDGRRLIFLDGVTRIENGNGAIISSKASGMVVGSMEEIRKRARPGMSDKA